MASIRTGIELQDNFSSVLYGIISCTNLAVSAMEDMSQAMNAGIDTSSLEGAREQLNQATIAADKLNQALQDMGTPADSQMQVPSAPVQQPVQVPVQWQSDNLDVFSGSGIERFQQEIQSADNMLGQLRTVQDEIRTNAIHTNVLSPEATQDISNIGHRIQSIRDKIQQLESNPIDFATDGASNDLERIRAQLNQALQEQNNLNQAVQNMDVGAANNAYLKLSQTISSTERYIRDNTMQQEQFNQTIQDGTTHANTLTDTIKRAAGAYITMQSIKGIVGASDELTQTAARLDLMNDGLQSTQELQDKIYLSAERARASYNATADSVAKFGLLAGEAFQSSDEIIAFSELMNKSFKIGGSSATEQAAAMYQLNQALSSGRLQGDEYRSIIENAPLLKKSIEDYMISVQHAKGTMKDWAADGMLTADVIKAALFRSADEINEKFEKIPMTWGDIISKLKNGAIRAFNPVLQRINAMANSEAIQTFVDNTINAMAMIASVVLNIFDVVGQVGGFIADNWSVIEPIVIAVAAAMGLYTAALIVNSAVQGINNIQKIIATVQEYAHAKAVLKNASAHTAETVATAKATVAQASFNTTLLACPITWIILAVIAFIVIVYTLVAAINKLTNTTSSAMGVICGVFAMAAAAIWNTILGVVNYVIGIGVELYNLIGSFANFFANVFDHPVEAILKLFADMFDFILGIVQSAATLIDTVLDSDISGAVEGFRNDFSNAVADIVGDQTVVVEKLNASDYQFKNRIDYMDAFGAGYDFGEKIDDKIKNFDLSKLTGKTDMPDKNDYLNQITNNTGNTKKNTDKIAKQLDITSEDLKYLRDIAERDVINRFTTAEIKVNMTNHNKISSEMDLDDVAEHLRSKLEEQMYATAEGVH